MPNNRQWAFIFWTAVLLAWALSRRDTRSAIWQVLRAVASPKVSVPLAVLVIWVVGLAYLASKIELWDADRVTDTAFWFITAGLVLFGRFGMVRKDPHFVRSTALATLEFSAIVEVLSEVFVLHLLAELILQPFLAMLGGLSVVAAQKHDHHQVKKLADSLIVIASAALLLYVLVSLVNSWESVDTADLLQQFALPVWLTIGVLPYIYAVGLYSAYESAFVRIDSRSDASWWARTCVKVALLITLHLKAHEVGAFRGPWQFELASATSFREARHVIVQFKRARRDGAC